MEIVAAARMVSDDPAASPRPSLQLGEILGWMLTVPTLYQLVNFHSGYPNGEEVAKTAVSLSHEIPIDWTHDCCRALGACKTLSVSTNCPF